MKTALETLKRKISDKKEIQDQILGSYGILINECICQTIDEMLLPLTQRIESLEKQLQGKSDELVNYKNDFLDSINP